MLGAGSNVIGHVIVDSGHIIIDSGSTTAVTQGTAANLNATVVGGYTPAGDGQTVAAGVLVHNQGFIYNPSNSNWDLQRTVGATTNSTGIGITAAGLDAQFDDVAPTTVSENNFGNVRMSANRNLYTTIRDAAGNERGMNIDANGGIPITIEASQTLATVTTVGTVTTITNPVAVTGSATGGAVPAGAFYQGFNASTALPTAATPGNLTGAMADKFGRQVILSNAIRDIVATQTTTITNNSETTIITQVASTFLDLVAIFISNTSATPVSVAIKDTTSGTTIFTLYVPANDMRGISLTTPWPQTTVNTNWTATASTGVSSLIISALFIKNK